MHHPARLAINRPWTYFGPLALHAVLLVPAFVQALGHRKTFPPTS